MKRRIRYEDLNWRVVVDDENNYIVFEESKEDSVGEKFWQRIGACSRDTCSIDREPLLAIFRSLLDRYTLDREANK